MLFVDAIGFLRTICRRRKPGEGSQELNGQATMRLTSRSIANESCIGSAHRARIAQRKNGYKIVPAASHPKKRGRAKARAIEQKVLEEMLQEYIGHAY